MIKIKRKTMVYLLLFGMFAQLISGTTFGTSALTKTKAENRIITVFNDLVSVAPLNFIDAKGVPHSIASSYEYNNYAVEPSDGVWINTDEMILSEVPIKEDGKTSLYHAKIPFEFDYNVFTDYGYDDICSTAQLASSDETDVYIGRFQVGYDLEDNNAGVIGGKTQDTGWNYGDWDIPAGELACIVDQKRWKAESVDLKPNTNTKSFEGGESHWEAHVNYYAGTKTVFSTDYHGDDGDNRFVSTQRTIQYKGNIGCYKLGTESGGFDVRKEQFTSQANYLTQRAKDIRANMNGFNIQWGITLNPSIGLLQSASFEGNNLIKNHSKTYMSISKIEIIANSQKSGYIEQFDPKDTSNFVVTPPTSSSLVGTKSGSDVPEQGTTNPKTGSYGSHTYSTKQNAIESDVALSTTEGGEARASLGASIVVDSSFANVGSEMNITKYVATITNTNLVPQVIVYKKDSFINYYEEWYDYKKNDVYRQIQADGSYHVSTLAGFEVKNVFVKERVRVTVDIYSEYKISTKQSPSSGNQSKTGDPKSSRLNQKMWDVSDNYDVNTYSTQKEPKWYDGWYEFWDDVAASFASVFGEDWVTYVWIIVIAIGVVVVILVYRYFSAYTKSMSQYGRGGYNPEFFKTQQALAQAQQAQAQAQMYNQPPPPALANLQQQNADLLRQIKVLQDRLNEKPKSINIS